MQLILFLAGKVLLATFNRFDEIHFHQLLNKDLRNVSNAYVSIGYVFYSELLSFRRCHRQASRINSFEILQE